MATNTTVRQWLKKEQLFDNNILKYLSEYGVVNAPYDLRTITQQKWDQLFRKCLAEKSKDLKSQSAKNRFEKRLKKVEKLWRIERKKPNNNPNENEPIIEPTKPSDKPQKELTKSTANWNKEFAQHKIEMQDEIDSKYQKTVTAKKNKRKFDEQKANNLRQWMRKEDVFDAYLLEIFTTQYCVYNAPDDFGKISQKEWTKIFRNAMAEKAKELKSQTAKGRFQKKLKKIEKVWRKQPKISKSKQRKEEMKQNSSEESGLIQSESEVTSVKTVSAKEIKKAVKKRKKVKYRDLSEKMNMFSAIETGDFKMLQTVQEYHHRNILSFKKGKIFGLHYCCTYERPKMLRFLLKNNSPLVSKINIQNYLGNTPAFVAVLRMSEYSSKYSPHSMECLKILCEWKVNKKALINLDLPNIKGRTILMHCALHNQIETLKYLMSHKIDLEIRDKQNQTALMYAVRHSNYESVMILCSYGARCDIKNVTGHVVSDYAEGKSKIFVDIQSRIQCIQYTVEGLQMVREIRQKQGMNIPMELLYIIVQYACDMSDETTEKANEIRDKTQKKLDKRIGKKQKRKGQRHVGPQTGGDYQGWFG